MMSKLDPMFADLWSSFQKLNPQAEQIHRLLTERGERVVNDHIAFRTFDDPRLNIDVLVKPFLEEGYQPQGEYQFPNKHLFARHYEHADPLRPRIFISELKLGEMSANLRETALGLIDQIPESTFQQDLFCNSGRSWDLDFATYQRLAEESEYAGWMSAFGFRANHFTVLVNELKSLASLEELNDLLKAEGFELNGAGGAIKGSPAELLEQSSTLAPLIEVEFADGTRAIPSCYYEFARRYSQEDGTLFSGFIAQSADKIFQSTDRREK